MISEKSSRGRLKSIITRCSTTSYGVPKSVIRRCSKRPNPDSDSDSDLDVSKSKKSRYCFDTGYTVDLGSLLFTRERDYLVRNNGEKVRARDLKGKTIVLYIVSINYEWCLKSGESVDIIEAYHELLPMGGTEFVVVPVYTPTADDYTDYASQEAYFNHLFSSLPFPAVPFSDFKACGDRVYNTFGIHRFGITVPYWVIVDPTATVVETRDNHLLLFKLFGGAELYPLSRHRILSLVQHDLGYGLGSTAACCEARRRLISNWDHLLASPTRDYLLSSNGDRVPISSLKGKLIGLYFCDNVPCPPRMDVIKEAYRQAKLLGYDFEIVQINFHYRFYHAKYCTHPAAFSKQQHYENINWLTLPFKDPCCRKLQRIFKCEFEDPPTTIWGGDCLVIIDPRQSEEVVFEFAGAEVIKLYGIEAYPFTRASVYELEYTRMKREVKLHLLFPPGLCQFTTRHGGFNLVNDSQLKGKRVIVLFAKAPECKNDAFVSMLKSKYCKQEENKFEVVYVPIGDCESSSFIECIHDMPWLIHPHSHEFGTWWYKIFKRYSCDQYVEAAAFGTDGQLIAKRYLMFWQYSELEQMEHRFPFFTQDLRGTIQEECQSICDFDRYGGKL